MKPHPNHPKFNQKRFKDRDLTIDEHFIIDEYGQQVMGDWEIPMMKKHVDILNVKGKDVLEIGFGMGISPTFFVESKPKSYTIVECHPTIIEKIYEWKQKYQDVDITIIEGEWFEKKDELKTYDCIFYDIFDDWYEQEFYDSVDEMLNEKGRFSFFNLSKDVTTYKGISCLCEKITVERIINGEGQIKEYFVPLHIKN
jgi:spermidine synthase